MNSRNIEIKAKCYHPDKIRKILLELNADSRGTDLQIDTYFQVPKGRLKLREGQIENNLIFYERREEEGIRESNFMLYKTDTGSELKQILGKVLDIKVIVNKQREIYFIDNVKFHIDHIENLGNYLEIEVMDQYQSIHNDILLQQCHYYMDLFNITEKDLVKCSYSDLFLL